jgi:hypothetical protein
LICSFHNNEFCYTFARLNAAANAAGYRWDPGEITFSAGVDYHFLIVFQGSGGSNGERIKIYKDGVRIPHTNAPYGDNDWSFTSTFDLSTLHWAGFGLGDTFRQSNIKVWNDVSTATIQGIIDSRNSETGYVYQETTTTDQTTTTATITVVDEYKFVGLGARDTEFGQTVKERVSVGEPFEKIYNRIRIKFGEEDTNTSYATAKESWTWGDSSSAYKFGVKSFEFENPWLDASQASVVAANLFNEYKTLKQEVKLSAKYNPLVDIYDRVIVKYITPRASIPGATLWGSFLWGSGIWTKAGSRNININDKEFKVLAATHNFDSFQSNFQLREL